MLREATGSNGGVLVAKEAEVQVVNAHLAAEADGVDGQEVLLPGGAVEQLRLLGIEQQQVVASQTVVGPLLRILSVTRLVGER